MDKYKFQTSTDEGDFFPPLSTDEDCPATGQGEIGTNKAQEILLKLKQYV